MTTEQNKRLATLLQKANELPSGGMMGMMMPGKREWALMKISIINGMEEDEANPFLDEWEEYFGISSKEPEMKQKPIKFMSQWGRRVQCNFHKGHICK